jgi:transposase
LVALALAQADVIARQGGQIEMLTKRIEDLEAKLNLPPKTPDNSSVPPSRGEKPNRAERRRQAKRKSHPGASRALAANPDRVVETVAETCPHCDHALSAGDQPGFHAGACPRAGRRPDPWDHIELPPIKPVVTRIHRHRGTCPCCRRGFAALAPEGMAPGSPFGPGLAALILHLHVTQAISYERLVRLLNEVFGITISEGAIANIMARAEVPMIVAAEKIAEDVRQAKVVASDETSARVKGKTWWQWVLMSSTAVYHLITDSRAAKVPAEFLKGAVPEVWVADRYAAQAGHALERQICLAHLLRDAQYAIDEGDRIFAPGFKALLLRAVVIGRSRDGVKDSTLKQYRAELHRRLDRLFKTPPKNPAARKLFNAMRRDRDDPRSGRGQVLFRFVTRRDVPYTNNGCERALRPSVIFRKVTGCFRSHWGARLYAAAASVIATGRLGGVSALQAIKNIIAPEYQTAPQ